MSGGEQEDLIFERDGWLLTAMPDDSFWLSAPSGEGMRFSAERMQRLLEELFDKEF